jgi:DNA-binding NarL/FixJ family response regulator|tara:strand:+ start:4 stop:210 length:207 start_codon:yes stop_codon:yes gene_type:complete
MRNTNKPPYAATDIPYAPKRRLTRKQFDVLWDRCCGGTQAQIAEKMGISRRAVRNHITRIRKRGIECP